MALLAALCAVVRVDIARAEAPGSASQAYCVPFVPLSMTQDVLVEVLLGEYILARVAAPRALALDALF